MSRKNSYFFLSDLLLEKEVSDCSTVHSDPEMGGANGIHGEESHMYKILVGQPAGKKKHLEELDLEENIIQYYINIILKIYFNKQHEKARIGLMWLQIQKNGGLSSTLKKLWVL